MTVYTLLAMDVFAPTNADGTPRSPSLEEAAMWGTEVERAASGASAGRVDQSTWAGLAAVTGTRTGQPAIVIGPDAGTHIDPVVGGSVPNVGEYYWSAAPAGWRRAGDLHRTLVHALNVGAGSADAVQATSDVQFSTAAYAALITVNFKAANTGAMTVSINGETPRALVTNTGAAIPAGYVQPDMAALVQIDADGNYRLFSYGDASAIQAAVEAALTAAEAARDAALSAVPNAFPVSRAAMAALDTGEVTSAYLKEAGREGQFVWDGSDQSANVTLDTTQGIYVPPSGDTTGASGAWVRVIGSGPVLASWFGTVGDDTTDDAEAWQVAAKFAGGRTLLGEDGKTYKLTDELVLEEGCTLDLCNSRMNFHVTGTTRCVAPTNGCRVTNGWIKNYGTGGSGVTGDFQTPVVIGQFAANVPYKNVKIDNLTLESDWTDGNGIMVTSSSNNVLIENITFPDSGMFTGIAIHWGGSDEPGGMGFPHHIVIRNIQAGDFNILGTFISLSGAYEVSVDTAQAGACRFGFDCYAGDWSNLYASLDVAPLVGKNIHVKNMVVTDIRGSNGAGVWIYGNSYYTETLDPVPQAVEMQVVMENSRFYGEGFFADPKAGPNAGYAVSTAFCRNVEIRNCHFEWFWHGITTSELTVDSAFVGNTVKSCYAYGMLFDLSTTEVINCTIERNIVSDVNLAGVTGSNAACIAVGGSYNTKVVGNYLGQSGEGGLYGVLVQDPAQYPVVRDNFTVALASGGTAYVVPVAMTDVNIPEDHNR